MCTVSFLPTKAGYHVAMNRDEKRTRVTALPPETVIVNGVRAVYPREPAGGTWVSVNEGRITLALINWHRIKREPKEAPLSRGQIIVRLAGASSTDEVSEGLRTLSLRRFRPFRLIGVVPTEHRVKEWRWDLDRLEVREQPWQKQHWFSSGFDEREAESQRAVVCNRWAESTGLSPADLRQLHQSHAPARGPFSICMHRSDAVTLSYTEIAVTARSVTMRYFAGAPCEAGRPATRRLSWRAR